MRKTSFADMTCPMARSLEVVGDWWTLLIVRDVMFLGRRRFAELQRALGIPTNVLSNRLQQLVDDGILERHDAPLGRSPQEYRPTTKGEELWPIMAALFDWGERWTSHDTAAPIELVHGECGTKMAQPSVCPGCGEELRVEEMRVRAKPSEKEFAGTA